MNTYPLVNQDGDAVDSSVQSATPTNHPNHLGYNPQIQCDYDPQLAYARRQNKQKLRRRFEDIFEKYERDFEGIGDEIDIETGEIIIDNGHLKNMQHEADTGEDGSRTIATADAQDLGHEGDVDSSEDGSGHGGSDEWLMPDEVKDSDDEDSTSGELSDGDFSAQDQDVDSATSPFDEDESEEESCMVPDVTGRWPDASSRKKTALKRPCAHGDKNGSDTCSGLDVPAQDYQFNVASHNILDQMPALKDSMLAFQSKYREGRSLDQNAIQALGMSIANQLAAFVSSGDQEEFNRKSKNSGPDTAWNYPLLPGDERKKRRLCSASPMPERTVHSPTQKSLWAPIRHPRPHKRQRLNGSSVQVGGDAENNPPFVCEDVGNDRRHSYQIGEEGATKTCTNCGGTDSYAWRNGPDGELCNTCGMYYYRYGLMKPTASLHETGELMTSEDSEGDVDPLRPGSSDSTILSRFKAIGVNNGRFRQEDDVLLIKYKEIDLLSWEDIALYFPGRSAYAVQCRYSKKLHGRLTPARHALIDRGYHTKEDANGIPEFAYSRDLFTDEEDELLLKLRDGDGLDWVTIATSFQGRTAEVLELRHDAIARQYLVGERPKPAAKIRPPREESAIPHVKNYRYSPEEDELIVKHREVDKLCWPVLAQKLPGRNAMSIQKRYVRMVMNRQGKSVQADVQGHHSLGEGGLEKETGETGGLLDESVLEVNKESSVRDDPSLVSFRDTQRLLCETVEQISDGEANQSSADQDSSAQVKHRDDAVATLTCTDPALNQHLTQDGSVDDRAARNTKQTETGSDALPVEKGFAGDEYRIIMNLGDLESPPRDSIAAQLPDRTVLSISGRYNHHLQPRKLPGTQNQTGKTILPSSRPFPCAGDQTPQPVVSHWWTQEEIEMVLTLREEGLKFAEIATRMPGRSTSAVANKYNHYCAKSMARTSLTSRSGSPDDQETEMPLPAHALGSQLATLPSRGIPHESLPEFHEDDERSHVSPETPIESLKTSPLSFDISPRATTSYSTPNWFQEHSHPYFLAPPARMDLSRSGYQQPEHEAASEAPTYKLSMLKENVAHRNHARIMGHPPPNITRQDKADEPTADVPARSTGRDEAIIREPVNDESSDEEFLGKKAHDNAILDDRANDCSADTDNDNVEAEDERPNDDEPGEPDEEMVRLNPPPVSLINLITMALKSKDSKAMLSKNIYKFMENRFPYFKRSTSGWRNSIRSTLSKNPQFRKVSDHKAALWTLVDAPVTSTKRNPGRPPKHPVKDLKGTPRKRGRPRKHPLPHTRSDGDPPPRRRRPPKASRQHLRKRASRLRTSQSQQFEPGEPPSVSKAEQLHSLAPESCGNSAPLLGTAMLPGNETNEEPAAFDAKHTTGSNLAPGPESKPSASNSERLTLASGPIPQGNLSRKRKRHSGDLISTEKRSLVVILKLKSGNSKPSPQLVQHTSSAMRSKQTRTPLSGVFRSTSVARDMGMRRVVHTPLREMDGSEDELAL